jgi:hypothetical protein
MQPNPGGDQVDGGQPDEDTNQEETAQRSRQTGGDAPAAASAEEREAVAEDRNHLFDPSCEERDDE